MTRLEIMLKEHSQNYTLLYRKEFKELLGSTNAAILLGQLIYWHFKAGGEFYKFKEPNEKHPSYKKGDSWCEELGFTTSELKTALYFLRTAERLLKNSKKQSAKLAFFSILNLLLNRRYKMYDAVCSDIANETAIENKLILAILALADVPLKTSELLKLFENSGISTAKIFNALSDLSLKGLIEFSGKQQIKLKAQR